MSGWKALEQHLEYLQAQQRERFLRHWEPDQQPGFLRLNGQKLLDLASNDYLGLACQTWTLDTATDILKGHPDTQIVLNALTRFGTGSSRLITGNDPIYSVLEREIAHLKGKEAALVFNSGMAVNMGLISTLLGREDAVFSDQLNHASIIDGIRLSKAQKYIFPHRDLAVLEQQLQASKAPRKLIVTDALFSMDGTLAPLPELIELKKKYGAWLMIDEAHTGGIFGDSGAGLAHEMGVSAEVDILMGTLSKAYGSVGAYIAGDEVFIRYLINTARTLIFTTGLPPANIAISFLNVLKSQKMNAERQTLHQNAQQLRQTLQAQGFDIAGSQSQVIPVIVGAESKALDGAKALQNAGYGVVAIRPPTVAADSSRLRLSLNAMLKWEDLKDLPEQIRAFRV